MERKRRSLWGSITTSEKVDQLTDSEALLYVWMITKCDDEGRMQGHPKTVKLKVCPGRNWSPTKIGAMLERLADLVLIEYYEVNGKKYIEIVDWKERQTFHGFKPEPSKYPSKNGESTLEVLEENFESNPTREVKRSKEKIREELLPLISSAKKIKGWNFTDDEDADFFGRLLADFPVPLVEKTIEDLRTYQERPAKHYKNLHSTLRNWCKREAERCEPEDTKPQAKLDKDGNPMYPLKGEWVPRKELDRMIADGEVERRGKEWVRKSMEQIGGRNEV